MTCLVEEDSVQEGEHVHCHCGGIPVLFSPAVGLDAHDLQAQAPGRHGRDCLHSKEGGSSALLFRSLEIVRCLL